MKGIFSFVILLLLSLSGFSQSFSVDNKSLSVPRYANQAAITAAITTPTEGMLVYNNALDQFAYYNGTVWTNLSTGTSGPTLWSFNNTTNRIEANSGFPGGIEARSFTSNAASTLSAPLINSIGNSNTFLRYGNPQTTAAIFQESTTGFSQVTSNITWKYYDDSNPQVANDMFGYRNNTFSVNGGMTASGNSSVGGTSTVAGNSSVGGTSTVVGRVTVGTATATTAGLEIRASTSTDANPDIYFKGTNNVLRFGNNIDGTSIIQSTTSANVPNSASLTWKHITNAATPVATPMMSLQGDGDLTVNGFTKLGEETTTTTSGVTRSSPAMKTILLTGTITATASPETSGSLTTTILHGITNWDKIINVQVILRGRVLGTFLDVPARYNDNRPSPGGTNGLDYTWIMGSTAIQIIRNATNSGNLSMPASQGVTAYAAPYRILITYIP